MFLDVCWLQIETCTSQKDNLRVSERRDMLKELIFPGHWLFTLLLSTSNCQEFFYMLSFLMLSQYEIYDDLSIFFFYSQQYTVFIVFIGKHILFLIVSPRYFICLTWATILHWVLSEYFYLFLCLCSVLKEVAVNPTTFLQHLINFHWFLIVIASLAKRTTSQISILTIFILRLLVIPCSFHILFKWAILCFAKTFLVLISSI